MLFLKQLITLPFLYHKSATTRQINSYKVSNCKLKSYLCNNTKSEIIEFIAPPQQPRKRGKFFLGYPVD